MFIFLNLGGANCPQCVAGWDNAASLYSLAFLLSFFGSWALFAFRQYRHPSYLSALPLLALIILAAQAPTLKPHGGTPEKSPESGFEVDHYENGQKRSEGNFMLGMKDGLQVEWWPNGHKSNEGHYASGYKYGIQREWSQQSGNLTFEGNHVDGEKDGLHTQWWADGQKLAEEIYSPGQLQAQPKWWDARGNALDRRAHQTPLCIPTH